MNILEVKLENIDYQTINPISTIYNSKDNNRGVSVLEKIIDFFDNAKCFSSSQNLKPIEFGEISKYQIERYTIDDGLLIITKKSTDKSRFPRTIKGLHIIVACHDNNKINYFQEKFDKLVASYNTDTTENDGIKYTHKLLHS